jgi:hypothetical protein
MKNYEEITQSVLNTAKVRRAAQKRRSRTIIASAAACACALALVLFAGIKRPAPEPADTATKNPTAVIQMQPRVKLLTAVNKDTKQELIEDVVTPFDLRMQVLDVRGMSEEEIDMLYKQEWDAAKAIISESKLDGRATQYGGSEAIITIISDGKFFVVIDDIDQVEAVSATCTSGAHINKNKVNKPNGDSGIEFTWSPSQEIVISAIEDDPTIKLSQFSDTVTVEVKFCDGTTETVVMDLIFGDSGQIYAVRRGTTLTAA